MPDKYQLIRISNDTLHIVKSNLSRDEIEDYPSVHNEDECDRMNPSTVYSVSDSNMSRIFGR